MRRTVMIARGTGTFLLSAAITVAGCSTKAGTGAAAGGAGGAAAGGAIGAASGAPVFGVGAIVGGVAGATIGGIIGASADKNDQKHREEATRVSEAAKKNPAVAAAVRDSTTADLNGDGWTTMDEVVALKEAGLNDEQMIDRLRHTQQVFYITSDQQSYLAEHGVSNKVIQSMNGMNAQLAGQRSDAPQQQ